MPLPAGTGLSRRSFLARSSGLALAVFGGAALAPPRSRRGSRPPQAAGRARVLVSVFLSGGLDALSLLAPVGDARYATLRPTLALPSGPARTRSARTPGCAGTRPPRRCATCTRAGKVTVIPAIGYDHPNQSHFTSRHYWEVGELDAGGRVGWLGRYLDRHGAADNPLQGLSLDYSLAPAWRRARSRSPRSAAPENYRLWTRDVWDSIRRRRGGSAAPGRDPDDRPGARRRPQRRRA